MNFKQIQLVEYAFHYVVGHYAYHKKIIDSPNKIKLSKIIIRSKQDVFSAETFRFNENGYLEFNKVDPEYALGYTSNYINLNDRSNPFSLVRNYIYTNYIQRTIDFTTENIIRHPEIFIETILEYIGTLNIEYEFEMPQVFYNYQSLLHKNFFMPFTFATNENYEVISVVIDKETLGF